MENDVNTEKSLFSGVGNSKNKILLTPTEIKVITFVSGGLSEKEIACCLNKSCKTIRKHIENIKKKSGLSKNTELVGLLAAEYNGKEFNLKKLREYGIAAFLIFVHVCKLDI